MVQCPPPNGGTVTCDFPPPQHGVDRPDIGGGGLQRKGVLEFWLLLRERWRARRAHGKVLYVLDYPNPSFGPFVEVCRSIIGGSKLVLHFLISFHPFSPFFCSFAPHPLLCRLLSPHFGDSEKAGVHTVVSLRAKSRIVIIRVARRANTLPLCGAIPPPPLCLTPRDVPPLFVTPPLANPPWGGPSLVTPPAPHGGERPDIRGGITKGGGVLDFRLLFGERQRAEQSSVRQQLPKPKFRTVCRGLPFHNRGF